MEGEFITNLLKEAKGAEMAKTVFVALARKLKKMGVKIAALLKKEGIVVASKAKAKKKVGKRKARAKDGMFDTFDVVIADSSDQLGDNEVYDNEEENDEVYDEEE